MTEEPKNEVVEETEAVEEPKKKVKKKKINKGLKFLINVAALAAVVFSIIGVVKFSSALLEHKVSKVFTHGAFAMVLIVFIASILGIVAAIVVPKRLHYKKPKFAIVLCFIAVLIGAYSLFAITQAPYVKGEIKASVTYPTGKELTDEQLASRENGIMEKMEGAESELTAKKMYVKKFDYTLNVAAGDYAEGGSQYSETQASENKVVKPTDGVWSALDYSLFSEMADYSVDEKGNAASGYFKYGSKGIETSYILDYSSKHNVNREIHNCYFDGNGLLVKEEVRYIYGSETDDLLDYEFVITYEYK